MIVRQEARGAIGREEAEGEKKREGNKPCRESCRLGRILTKCYLVLTPDPKNIISLNETVIEIY